MYWHVFVHGYHRVENQTRYGQAIVVANTAKEAEGLARARFGAWLDDVEAHPAISIGPIDGCLSAILLRPSA